MNQLRYACCLLALMLSSAALAQEDLSEAEQIYQERCSSCHGRNLTGGNAQSMVDGVWLYGNRDSAIARTIQFGASAAGMPAYGDAFSGKQIAQLVKFIRKKEAEGGVEPPPISATLFARDYDVRVEKWVADGIEIPWSIVFADEHTALLTERPGRLRMIRDGKLDPAPVSGTPNVLHQNQGGLMDVAVDPDYQNNGWVYLTYSHALTRKDRRGNPASMTRVIRGRITDGEWTKQQLLFEAPQNTYRYTFHHYGSRLAFDPEGHLLFTIGERGHQDDAQDPRLPNGKVHRIWPDGSIPKDNPFADGRKGMRSVYTYGNRNPQGLCVHPVTGQVWETEHGPMGGDEVNLIKPGVNYGWPRVTYGINYNGKPVSDKQKGEGFEQPVYFWAPSIAVCGADFCRGDEFPRWHGDLIVAGLGHEILERLVIDDGRVIHTEPLLRSAGRVRDVECGPDGALYVLLNNPDVVLRLTNAGAALRQ